MRLWLWWVRRDLRLEDNPALRTAAAGGAVIPVFIHSPADETGTHAPWGVGAASAWWLHRSLQSLHEQLHSLGSRLIIRRGDPALTLARIAAETSATGVAWNRIQEPAQQQLESAVIERLEELDVYAGEPDLLHEPTTLLTGAGTGYKVFTPFWRSLRQRMPPTEPLPCPTLPSVDAWPMSESLSSLELLPSHDWTAGLQSTWTPGEAGATKRLHQITTTAAAYEDQRNYPAIEGTSRLSPHLHFGELSPRQAWWAALQQVEQIAEPWLRQLAWREFSHHLLWHEPKTVEAPLRPEFARFPWQSNEQLLQRWQRGQTGYPIVDAGMRQLWQTGWMHNRVRMIVASFLVKDLLLPWQQGARWFWDTLVDADLANNTMGWQWTAGCGADAAPFFRIFNPVAQGRRFDADGQYVRHWVPEISDLPNRWIHEPWNAPQADRGAAGLESGKAYPAPIVDHQAARKQALAAYGRIKSSSPKT